MALNAFFSYFGGKSSLARYYPPPEHETVIEPFAGAAGYATRYHRRRVVLVEKNPRVAEMWRYLIGVSARELLALPDLGDDQRVSSLQLPAGARTLIGFNIGYGQTPRDVRSPRARGGRNTNSTWSPALRARLAAQVDKIRHWQVIQGDYRLAPNIEATWYIDPPYQQAGTAYPCGADAIDFAALAEWCKSRRGQVIVCENEGADWLPFRAFYGRAPSSNKAASNEVIWTNDGREARRA